MSAQDDIAGICIPPDMPIGEALDHLDKTHKRILLITDPRRRISGVVTDPDFRRAILMRVDFARPVSDIMTKHPVIAHLGMSDGEILALMEKCNCHGVPVVDETGRVVRLVRIQDILAAAPRPSGRTAVIMAGGLGERLRPLTEQTPKPLLSVGDKPILFTILDRLLASHFDRIYIAVNYKADVIEESVLAVPHYRPVVRFLREEHKLGTVGGISLVPERPEGPVLVTNGDLLTNISYEEMLRFHEIEGNSMTVALAQEQVVVPYGIVELEASRIVGIQEKPVFTHFINAGVYVLSPECFDLIWPNKPMDMTDLINVAIESNRRVGGFLLREYWLDIGLPHQLEKARQEYRTLIAAKPGF